MSIGAAFQWPQYPTAVAADRAVKEGMVVVASIGNSGANGLYSASAPGNGNRVIGVASFDNTHANLVAFAVSPHGALVGYSPATGAPAPPTTGTFLVARTGTPASTADACNGATAPAPGSLAGRIALIRRGTCGFYEKAFNAQAAGAVGVVIYNNAAGLISATVVGTPAVTIPVVTIQATDGVTINDRVAAGPVQLTWTSTVVSVALPTAGLISSFSSYGLPPDLSLKPDLGAPGGTIRSTVPLEQGAFGPNSGTSMAAPHVAGAAALLLQARPTLSPGHVSALLQNNADPRRWFGNPALGFLDNAHRQGGGMLNIVEAIQSRATTSPSKLALGEIQSGTVTREIAVGLLDSPFAVGDWSSRSGVTFTLGHEPALSTGANTFTPSFLSAFASVSFSTPTITVGGSQAVKATFNVTVTPPANANARIFGGYITLTPDNGSAVLRVPYAGYNGDYQAIPTLVPTANNFPWLARQTGPTTYANQPTGATYTMVGSDVPVIVVHLDHATPRLILDVYDAATGKWRGRAPEEKFLPRNSGATTFFAIPWDGTLGGVAVPNGSYRIEMSVLKALGDRNNPAHTERWTSPNIVIARPTTTP
jgi:subtilisin family serine protease